jgi:hypothetical protein
MQWFLIVCPQNWQFGTRQIWHVRGLGAVGLALMGIPAVIVPLVMDPREATVEDATAARETAEAERTAAAADQSGARTRPSSVAVPAAAASRRNAPSR